MSKSNNDITIENCREWIKNKTINPRTGRSISENGPIYKVYKKECDKLLKNLKSKKIKKNKKLKDKKCLICLEKIKKKDLAKLKCGHRFHKECIDLWAKIGENKCPICKVKIQKKIIPKKAYKQLGCSSKKDIITLDKLSNDVNKIAVITNKKPYHCFDLKSFYNYWKNVSTRDPVYGLKPIRNPYTNLNIDNNILKKIKKQIQKVYPKLDVSMLRLNNDSERSNRRQNDNYINNVFIDDDDDVLYHIWLDSEGLIDTQLNRNRYNIWFEEEDDIVTEDIEDVDEFYF